MPPFQGVNQRRRYSWGVAPGFIIGAFQAHGVWRPLSTPYIHLNEFPRNQHRIPPNSMSQSLAKILLHLIYSTKNRERTIRDDIRAELHRYTAGILKELESPAILINSVEDHVHILYAHSKNLSLSKVVEEVKKGSSKWIKTKGTEYSGFHWQAGYGVFSVSQSGVIDVVQYIQSQKEHHHRKTFQEKYREFLKRYEVAYGERYVWD